MNDNLVLELRLAIVDEQRILDAIAALQPRSSWWMRLIAWVRS